MALVGSIAGCGSGLRTAYLGDLPLGSGEVVRDCSLGYRTFGRLDATASNVVLLLPWFLGRSAELSRFVGPGRLLDSSRYFVVAVDSLGNGVSTSPSNSRIQPGEEFPRYTVRDIVEAQRRMLRRELRIDHLRAVVGISMGGMQAFQWMTAHPDFMDKAVAIAATPRVPVEDRRQWMDRSASVRASPPWRRAATALLGGDPLGVLRELRVDAIDYARQAEALASTDVSVAYGGSLERAALSVRARTLVVVSARDDVVDPGAARQFAALAGSRLLELDGRCGHSAPSCERKVLWPAVERFLAE
jgi:homoserine O-acetyltransferase/O-succinyltransferase